jgi:hypothetical protein
MAAESRTKAADNINAIFFNAIENICMIQYLLKFVQ